MRTEKEIQGNWKDVIMRTPFKITLTICQIFFWYSLFILYDFEQKYKRYKRWVLEDSK